MPKVGPNFKVLEQICQHCGKPYGKMCRSCAKRKNFSDLERFSMFEKSANAIHSNKYKYIFNGKFTSINSYVDIDCPIHGKFSQSANTHLKGFECERCGYERRTRNISKTTEQFIMDAKKMHGDKYDYSLVNYVNGQSRVEIICPKHGSFFQIAANHTRKDGYGCSKCTSKFKSDICDKWLNEIESIIGSKLIREYRIPGTKYHVDGYSEEFNICFEFLGDYWHGNLELEKHREIKNNTVSKKTFRELNDSTFERFDSIINLGYKVAYVWENNYKNKSMKFTIHGIGAVKTGQENTRYLPAYMMDELGW